MTNWLLACLYVLTVSRCHGQVEKEYHLPYRSGAVDYQHFDLEKDGIRMPGRTYIKIWLKAKNDAHFLLQKVKTDYFNNVVELVIGGWGNGKSVIRDRQQGPALGTKRHRPLSSSTYRPFWYSWAGGCIKVGTGHTIDADTFMDWCGVTHAINYLSIGAGYGSDGWMKFYVLGTLQTPTVTGSTPDYTKADVHGEGVRIKGMNYLKFQVRAAQQAYVLLQKTRFDYTNDVAEIALDIPTASALRLETGGSSVATYSSPVLSGTEFRDFWVKWSTDCIWVGKGLELDEKYMMEWCGASELGRTLEFNYLSVSTAGNNDGNWIINRTICTSNCHRSCTDVKCAQDDATSGVYTLYNTANEPFDVYCEFHNGYGYQYVSAKTTVDLPIGNLFKEDKSHVMMRHFRTDGTQYETKIEQLSSYSSRDLSVQYNSYTGYTRPDNDAMTPYIYFSLITVAGMDHEGKTLGYKAAGQDQTYVNCDGNENSYWAFLFNQGCVAEERTPGLNSFMNAWVDLGTKVSSSRHMPSDYASFYEMHMGGCGGYSTTTAFPNVVGAALGMKFTFVSYGSWSACSASCGEGQQTRSKTCNGISLTDTRVCQDTPCQVPTTTTPTTTSTTAAITTTTAVPTTTTTIAATTTTIADTTTTTATATSSTTTTTTAVPTTTTTTAATTTTTAAATTTTTAAATTTTTAAATTTTAATTTSSSATSSSTSTVVATTTDSSGSSGRRGSIANVGIVGGVSGNNSSNNDSSSNINEVMLLFGLTPEVSAVVMAFGILGLAALGLSFAALCYRWGRSKSYKTKVNSYRPRLNPYRTRPAKTSYQHKPPSVPSSKQQQPPVSPQSPDTYSNAPRSPDGNNWPGSPDGDTYSNGPQSPNSGTYSNGSFTGSRNGMFTYREPMTMHPHVVDL